MFLGGISVLYEEIWRVLVRGVFIGDFRDTFGGCESFLRGFCCFVGFFVPAR